MTHLKKSTLLLFLLLNVAVFGQELRTSYLKKVQKSVRLNLYGSYVFQDSFDSYYDYGNYYQGKLNDGFQYGTGVEFEVTPDSYLEVQYLRQDTQAPTQYYNGGRQDQFSNFDVAMNYIMLSGNRSFRKPGGTIDGFGGLMAGMAILSIHNPQHSYSESLTKLAWGLKGGVIVWASKKVGIKFQGQLLSVAQSVGGDVYFGSAGVSTGLSSYSSIYQFSLGGGLVFELAN